MSEIRELTEQYVSLFSKRDTSGCLALMQEDITLQDPVVGLVSGKSAAQAVMEGIFKSCESMTYKARNIYVAGNVSILEFVLILDTKIIEGVDIIQWCGNKMEGLRAYLDAA